jgi:hypothetical protein
LSGSDGACKLPIFGWGFINISRGWNRSKLVKTIVLGEIEVLLVLMIDRISRNGVGVDDREGLDSKSLLEHCFI